VELSVRVDGVDRVVELERSGANVVLAVDGRRHEAVMLDERPGRVVLLFGTRVVTLDLVRTPDGVEVGYRGHRHVFVDADHAAAPTGDPGGGGDGRITTPMPGKVVAVNVSVGDVVTRGQTLLVLESMKMQNDIAAGVDGTVTAVHHAPGDGVSFGDLLVEIDPTEDGHG
jgi:biotin carboxyl carrier protein